MIKAFRKQLKTMALDPQDPYTRQIRMLAGTRDAVRFESPLREMILRMPDLLVQIREWVSDTSQPPHLRRLQNFALAYLYNPKDYLPESSEGFFGYLDDAYLVTRTYQITVDERELQPEDLSHAPLSVSDPEKWVELTRELIPGTTRSIEQVLQTLTHPSERVREVIS